MSTLNSVYLKEPPPGYWERELAKGTFPYVLGLLGSNREGADPILDLGCEAGRTSLALASRGHRVIGVDLFHKALAFARKNASASATFLCADAGVLPFSGGSFGTVLMVRQFISLFHDRQVRLAILREAHRVLKPGGTIILSVQNRPLSKGLWHAAYAFALRFKRPSLWTGSEESLVRFAKRVGPVLRISRLARRVAKDGDHRIRTKISETWQTDVPFHEYSYLEIQRDLFEAGFILESIVDADVFTGQSCPPRWLLRGAPLLAISASRPRQSQSES